MKKIVFLISIFLCVEQINAQVWSTTSQPFGNVPDGSVEVLFNDTSNNLLYAAGTFPSSWYVTVYNGSNWDTVGTSFNGYIFCMTLYNGEWYAGGYFTANGSTPISRIARWDGLNWQPVGAGLDNAPFSLTVYNGELYAGGLFTQAGGNAVNYIAKWDGNVWTTVGSGMDNYVYSLCVYNGGLYAGGFFMNAGGNSAKRIAKWDGLAWSTLANGVSNGIRSMVEYNNDLYAAGDFVMASGTTVNHIAKWDGVAWSSLVGGLDSYADHLCVYNSELYVTGDFTASGTISLDGIGRWNGSGWSALGTPPGGIKNCIADYGGNLYMGGHLLYNTTTNYLVTWNNPPSFPPTANFFANDSIIEAGSFVQFTNQSTGSSVTCNWSFPGANPATSVNVNPLVNYAVPGIYPVTLIASNSAGSDTLIKSTYIHVTSSADPVSYGISTDYTQFLYDHSFYNAVEVDTCVYGMSEIYYYKPLSYDSITSPILWAVHGLGGNGSSTIGSLQAIADRRHALIVSVTMENNWPYDFNSYNLSYFAWYQSIFKQIYRHVLYRESRSSIPVYLIGFSAGGQCVSRFMLIRQGVPDSIPIRMAVSTNPFSYTFCTDTFLNVPMPFPCGLMPGYTSMVTPSLFDCNEHVVQYYNENYGVLIGTGDVAPGFLFHGDSVQGNNRYERAQNFYAFSDSNAVTRGTLLQWPYVEIPGIGHDQVAMWNTKVNVTDSSTIAETLLFDTPYHTVPSLAPVANFNANTTMININGTINFSNTSANASAYSWDFGDDSTSTLTNPSHSYTVAGTYTVKLTAISSSGCNNTVAKKCYITVIDPNFLALINDEEIFVKVTPNPAHDKVNITTNNISNKLEFTLYDILGKEHKHYSFIQSSEVNIQNLTQGIYFYKIYNKKSLIGVGKIIKE